MKAPRTLVRTITAIHALLSKCRPASLFFLWMAVLLCSCACMKEGSANPFYLRAGRFEGTWEFDGELPDLRRYGVEWTSLRLELIDPPTGSWRNLEPPNGPLVLPEYRLVHAKGKLIVDQVEYYFRLEDRLDFGDVIVFDVEPPVSSAGIPLSEIAIELDAFEDPCDDRLYLGFGYQRRETEVLLLPYRRARKV